MLTPNRRQRVMTCAASALAAATLGLCAFSQSPTAHTNDFVAFWSAARMVGSDLYDPAKAQAVRAAEIQNPGNQRYIRPPFYALLLWPLGRLPFHWAYLAWQVLNFCALAGFIRLWRRGAASYFACALYLPLLWNFGVGQDAPIMLLIVAVGTALIARGRQTAGGAVLALCAAKAHLFAFIPFVLLRQRRALGGFLTAGTILYLLSATIAGWRWPELTVRASLEDSGWLPPSLLGFAALWRAPVWSLLAGFLLLGSAIYFIAARINLGHSIAAATALGLVLAPHSVIYDGALFLPLVLTYSPALVPIVGIALTTIIGPAAIIARLTSLGLAAYAFIETRRESVDVIPPPQRAQGETSA